MPLIIDWSYRMGKHMRLAGSVLAAICIVTPVLAQNPGEAIYKQNCAVCHGPDGEANTPVAKALKAQSLKAPAIIKKSDAELIEFVKKGKGNMPAFGAKLSDSQVKEVIAYVRALQKK